MKAITLLLLYLIIPLYSMDNKNPQKRMGIFQDEIEVEGRLNAKRANIKSTIIVWDENHQEVQPEVKVSENFFQSKEWLEAKAAHQEQLMNNVIECKAIEAQLSPESKRKFTELKLLISRTDLLDKKFIEKKRDFVEKLNPELQQTIIAWFKKNQKINIEF